MLARNVLSTLLSSECVSRHCFNIYLNFFVIAIKKCCAVLFLLHVENAIKTKQKVLSVDDITVIIRTHTGSTYIPCKVQSHISPLLKVFTLQYLLWESVAFFSSLFPGFFFSCRCGIVSGYLYHWRCVVLLMSYIFSLQSLLFWREYGLYSIMKRVCFTWVW